MELTQEYLYAVQAATEQWTDQRVIDSVDLENLLLFWVYGPKVLSQSGVQFRGAVFRHKGDQTLMTVKAQENGTPLVVFVTSQNPISCVSRFWDLLEDDRLVWRKDKYPWI